MTEYQPNKKTTPGKGEIDLFELVKNLWSGRWTIIKTITIGAFIGLLIAIFSAKEYTTTVTIVPQTPSRHGNLGSLSGLAAMAGINVPVSQVNEISPYIYPQITSSIPFQLELMNTPLDFEKIDQPVTFLKYYSEYVKPNPLIKYTIGLPGVILRMVRGEPRAETEKTPQSLIRLTEGQKHACAILKRQLTIQLNDKDGYIQLSCRMPEALPSAQLAQRAQELLQRQITEYKIQKVVANLEFIQQRYSEVKQQYNQAQEAFAKFSDRNKNITTAFAQTELERLKNDYNLAYSIYSEIAKQLEQTKIQVKENTPVFTIIEPASIPLERSKPKRLSTLILWSFLGGVIGVGIVFFQEILKNLKAR